jgi:hypothetical protein
VAVTDGSARVINFRLKSKKDSFNAKIIKQIVLIVSTNSNVIVMLGALCLAGSLFLVFFAVCYRRRSRNYETNRNRKEGFSYAKVAESEDELFASAKYVTQNEKKGYSKKNFFSDKNNLSKNLLNSDDEH